MTWPALSLHEISTVSPSRFNGMGECPLREAWSAGRAKGLLASSPGAFLGNVVHKLVESAMLGHQENLEQQFDEFAASIERQMATDPVQRRWVPLSEHATDYAGMRLLAIERAHAAAKQLAAPAVGARRRVGPEVRVSARAGKIRGSIDEVIVSSAGQIILRDLKTGTVRKSGSITPEPKPEYAVQLRMYAAMYAEDVAISDGKWPDQLELVPLYGPPLDVPYDRGQCTALLDEAVEALRRVNDVIAGHDEAEAERILARPAPGTCRWCKYRPACTAYRAAAQSADSGDWPPDVWGEVADMVSRGNGTVAISVRHGGKLCRVRDILPSPIIHPALHQLEVGATVAIFGLIRARAVDTFSAGTYTVIHILGSVAPDSCP